MGTKITQDYLAGKKRPQRATTYIIQDDEMAERYEFLEQSIEALKNQMLVFGSSESTAIQTKLSGFEDEFEELREELKKEGKSYKFVFQSIGPKRYDKLMDDHPFPDAMKEKFEAEGREPLPYDPETFSMAIIAASSFEPKLTEEFVRDEIRNGENWSSGEFGQLYQAALEANNRKRNINLGKGFKRTSSSSKS